MTRMNRQRRHKGKALKRTFGLFFTAIILCILAIVWWGNPLHEKLNWGIARPVFVEGQLTDYSAVGEGDTLSLPLEVIQQYVDSAVWHEESTDSVVLSTRQKVMRLILSENEAELNGSAYALTTEVAEKDGVLYVPFQAIAEIYGATVHEDASTGAVLLMRAGEQVDTGNVSTRSGKSDSTSPLRSEPSKYAPIVADMPQGTALKLWSEAEGWYYAQMDNGTTGYVQANDINPGTGLSVAPLEEALSLSEQHWEDKPVNLAWEAVYSRNPRTAEIGPMPGVNVVSPTWFEIATPEGKVNSKANMDYVRWAHNRGMEVWGLLSNSFEPDLTTEALSTYERRKYIIQQTIDLAKSYDLDGINIDFENVYTKDGPYVTQFMRELKPLARANDLILSIDVTPKSNSEMWSVFLDRKSLGEVTDYMMLMAYDEHWAASPKSGSVASLPWTESSIRRIIDEDSVPPKKLVLGIPLYTRVWSEEEIKGETKVSSKAIGMSTAASILSEFKLDKEYLDDIGQNYVEYKEDGTVKKIWLEDEVSLQARVEQAKSFELGGIGVWNRNFANDTAWKVLSKFNTQ